VEFSTLLPSRGEGEGVGQAVTGIISQRWSGATLHVNGSLGLTRVHNRGAAGGIIIEGPDRWPVRPVAEVTIEHGDDTATTGLVGAIWNVRDRLAVDVGLRASRSAEGLSRKIRGGLTFSFGIRSFKT
jgi:hypothetical protein